MKGYRSFIIIFSVLLVLYIITEVNRPKPTDWSVTLSKDDKIPYGGYIIHQRLKDIFPGTPIHSFRTPLYDQINNYDEGNSAYIIITPVFNPSKVDLKEMRDYLNNGNFLFISANDFAQSFLDTFKLRIATRFSLAKNDSTSINFVNSALRAPRNYTFYRSTIDQYFSKVNNSNTVVAGINNHHEANFVKISVGSGALFVHSAPVCFSNYFLLHKNNAAYAAKALSYIPEDVAVINWDEYYKTGREEANTPFRFLLSNEFLRWALRIALTGLMLYIIFQMKRRQRVIPVIEPLRNTSLEFVKTVSSVYFNQKDNSGIAHKKAGYFLDFIRQRFNLSTNVLDESFTEQLSRKSGVDKAYVSELVNLLVDLPTQHVDDNLLLRINNTIDNFYKQV